MSIFKRKTLEELASDRFIMFGMLLNNFAGEGQGIWYKTRSKMMNDGYSEYESYNEANRELKKYIKKIISEF